MNKLSKIIKIGIIAVLLITSVLCTSCGKNNGLAYPETVEELKGLHAGAEVGSIEDQIILSRFPDATIDYYTTPTDQLEALLSGKIDYFIMDYFTSRSIVKETEGAKLLDESIDTQDLGVVFRQDDPEPENPHCFE